MKFVKFNKLYCFCMFVNKRFIYVRCAYIKKTIKSSNTRVSAQVSTNQHESKRINTNPTRLTRINTSSTKAARINTSQHESTRVRRD